MADDGAPKGLAGAAPAALVEALQVVVSMIPQGPGQRTLHREIIGALGSALDARRQRIIVSEALHLQAICDCSWTAFVRCGNRLASGIAMGLFATGVAVSVLLVVAHYRPFTGQISIGPEPLLQIMPAKPTGQ
jgi:hypothetical protein